MTGGIAPNERGRPWDGGARLPTGSEAAEVSAGLGKTTGWFHRTELRHRRVTMIAGATSSDVVGVDTIPGARLPEAGIRRGGTLPEKRPQRPVLRAGIELGRFWTVWLTEALPECGEG